MAGGSSNRISGLGDPEAKSLYLRMAACRFARPHLEGRSVAYLEGGEPGYAPALLAGTAGPVTVLGEFDPPREPAEVGLTYQRVVLPDLPYPDGYFGAVVAFGVVEGRPEPEAVVREASRVLGEDGTLVLCTPDKQAHSNERNRRAPIHRRALYIPELRELLENHFREVRLYRIGAVTGGLVSDLEEASAGTAETAGAPAGDFVLAICGPEASAESPRLFLDKDGLAFEELEEARGETELLRTEIRQMQETEVRAFRDALALERSRASRLGRELEESQGHLEDQRARSTRLSEENSRLKAVNGRLRGRLKQIEASRTWRVLGLYRRLMKALRGSVRSG